MRSQVAAARLRSGKIDRTAYGSAPFTRTAPEDGRSARDATRISVVFPDPLGPTSPTTSPADACIETSWTTGGPWYPAVTRLNSSSGMSEPPLSPEEVQEERRAEQRGDRADGELLRRDRCARGEVGQDQED